jgi:tRNA(fMet)-specific endonuclease VapC
LTIRVDAALSAIDVLPLDTPSDRHYGTIRDQLAKKGTPIGPNDLLIAVHAMAEGLTLVTDNVGEFRRVEGLAVVNWKSDE